MPVRLPRISISADFGNDNAMGEFNISALGFGIHQAWVYATMFSATNLFGAIAPLSTAQGLHISYTYLSSITVFAVCLIAIGLMNINMFDGKTMRNVRTICAALTTIGTAILLYSGADDVMEIALETASGLLTGLGTAGLIICWGFVFANQEPTSIALNSTLAIVLGIVFFALILCNLPFPIAGILTALLPLLELYALGKATSRDLEIDQMHPFSPLPVKKASFTMRFGLPIMAFGFGLGVLRQICTQNIVISSDFQYQVVLICAAGISAVLLFVSIVATDVESAQMRILQILLPIIVLAFFLLSASEFAGNAISDCIILIAYICFETTLWIFFGTFAQRYRLSPRIVFGIGRGCLALASLIGTIAFLAVVSDDVLVPGVSAPLLILFVLVLLFVAYMLLPTDRAVERFLDSSEADQDRTNRFLVHMRAANAAGRAAEGSTLAPEKPATEVTEQETRGELQEPAGEPTGLGGNAQEDAMHGSAPGQEAQGPQAVNRAGSEAPADASTPPSEGDNLQEREAHAPADEPAQSASMPAGDTEAEGTTEEYLRHELQLVANAFLLSKREIDVAYLLARGHNSAYIQEKLYISEGTAKTHIRHIYRKLDIHSQEELIRMVEEAGELFD